MSNEDEFILSGYDDMGYDDMGGDDEAGWNPFKRRRAAPRRGVPAARRLAPPAAPAAARRQALRQFQPDATGLPLDQIMPFPAGVFTAAVTTLLLQAQPQREFQPRRLVIDLGRVGATATGLVTVTQFTVGADPQFVNTGAIPASMFQATAVGILLKPAAARPGVTISLGLSIAPAPGAGDTVTVSAAAVGPAVG